jgi:two-component sensor histidine kinase
VSRRLIIDLPVRNEWSNVEVLRTAVLSCFTAVFNDLDSCRTVATVIGELMENAIKYGDWDPEGERSLHLAITGEDKQVLVSVEHPVNPTSPELARLHQTIRWLATFPRPEDAYRARLNEYADNPPGPGVSRLGLARIAYEGNCSLSAEVNGKTLRVCAALQQ